MSPGDYRKKQLKLLEVTTWVNLFSYMDRVDVEWNYEHSNVHGRVTLQKFDALEWFKMFTHKLDYVILNIFYILNNKESP